MPYAYDIAVQGFAQPLYAMSVATDGYLSYAAVVAPAPYLSPSAPASAPVLVGGGGGGGVSLWAGHPGAPVGASGRAGSSSDDEAPVGNPVDPDELADLKIELAASLASVLSPLRHAEIAAAIVVATRRRKR